MIDLTFDNGTVERFTLVLSQRDYTHLGQITNVEKVKFKANLNAADELSFEVYKELDGIEERLWDDIYDLRLVWIPELDEYFEIDVESTDTVYITKTVTAKSLCESELSQTYLHDIEINTADDIARPDYDENYPTVFYRDGGSEVENKASLLHRILEKAPAYTIGHVDDTLKSQQRIFSISDTSLYDFMVGECSEQFNCLFQFDSATRTISAYDLQSTCMNDDCSYYTSKHLRYRGLFNDFCPICGSSNITSFGEDTNVFVSTENLTDEVKFDTDVNSMKNCFRLEAGDDNMTAAVINSNPNGTRYIYEFNAETKKDMPTELVNLINSYDTLYETYNESADMQLNTSLISSFNALCNKYNNNTVYKKGTPWSTITTPVNGYKNLIPHYYNCIDFYQYLKSSLMPVVAPDQRDINQEMTYLLANLDSTIGMSVQPTAQASVESAITNLCKLYINSGLYKVSVSTDTWSASSWATWKGKITLTSFEDDTITKTSSQITRTISTNFSTFMEQKISKYIKRAKESADYYDVLKESNLSTFRTKLKNYSAVRLQSIRDSLSAVLGILVEAGQGVTTADLYSSFYTPYYQKLQAAETELNLRNQEIEIVNGIQDANGNSTKKGVLQYIIDSILKVQKALNFKEYIYDHTSPKSYDLYNVYTTYIREETYSNSNYISDDLNNDQLFENAGRFLDMAKTELHKSAMYQHSITSNLNNLIAIPAFKPLLNKFNLGNWIRVQEDERVYRLRLISYSIDFDNITKLDTEFSDVTMTADGLNDVMSIIKQASSMATSYGYTQQQASDGADVKYNYIDRWVEDGLNSALVKINNNTDEDISIDNTGILARTYDDIEDEHGPKQLRITHNVIAFTKDNWESVETAVGEFHMHHHHITDDSYGGLNTNASLVDDYDTYGLVAKDVLSGWIVGSHMESSTIIGSHFQAPGNNTYFDMTDSTAAGRQYFIKCNNGSADKFTVKKDGTVYVDGSGKFSGGITAQYGTIGNWTIDPINASVGTINYSAGALYSGTPGSAAGMLLSPTNDYTYNSTYAGAATGTKWKVMLGKGFGIDKDGNLYISGNITASAGSIDAGIIKSGTIDTNRLSISGIVTGINNAPTTTTINGGKISTGTITATQIQSNTITANQIKSGTITSNEIKSNTITASQIQAGTITSNEIKSNTITAGNMNVSQLSAISADLGTVTAGTINGTAIFRMSPGNATASNIDGTLNWGDTWGDSLVVESDNNADSSIGVCKKGDAQYRAVYMHYNDIRRYYHSANPEYAEFNPGSDERIKKDIEKLSVEEARLIIDNVEPLSFRYIKDDKVKHYGFTAQRIEKQCEKYGLENPFVKYGAMEGDLKNVSYMQFISPIIRVIQDQQSQINELKQEINRLKGEQNG